MSASAPRHISFLWISAVIAICWSFANVTVALADEEAPLVTARLADGTVEIASLRSIANGEIAISGRRVRRVPVSELIRLDFRDALPLSPTRASLIQLVNGDRVVAGLASMSDEAVIALWKSFPDWSPVRIPAEAVAGILTQIPIGAWERSRAFNQVFGQRPKTDVILLHNGDRAVGDLTGFDQAHLKLTQGGKPLQIDVGRVRGVSFNAQLTNVNEPKKPRVQVMLTDGSLLTGSGALRELGGPLRMTASFGAALEVPLSAISAIRFLDGRATYLSDLRADRAELAGFFGPSDRVALSKDRNACGGPLVVRGKEYPKGLGTRSSSAIHFFLRGAYHSFQTLAALDDLADGKGSVRFAVELDGRRVYSSGLATGRSSPLVVGPIDVHAAQQLTLIVEYGELADVGDWADWCDALLIR